MHGVRSGEQVVACLHQLSRGLGPRLHDILSGVTLDETGQKMRVYLDQTRLEEDGQRWDSGFMTGLAQSWVFVPIVSVGSVAPMVGLSEGEDWVDNVLLEFTSALELYVSARAHQGGASATYWWARRSSSPMRRMSSVVSRRCPHIPRLRRWSKWRRISR